MTIRYATLTDDERDAICTYANNRSGWSDPLHIAACAAADILTTTRQHRNNNTSADAYAAALTTLCQRGVFKVQRNFSYTGPSPTAKV
jgi:protein-S-isoprenylcysteine O-methyltransferase Ste14